MVKYFRVVAKCENCGNRASNAGDLTSDMFWTYPVCGYGLNSNPRARDSIGAQPFRPSTPPRTTYTPSTPPFTITESKGSFPSTSKVSSQQFSVPEPLFWGAFIVLVAIVLGAYILVEMYGLARVAFTTGAAIIIFSLTTIFLSGLIESKRHQWLATIIAPIGAAMFAITFWYLLINSPYVDELIQRLMGSYLGAVSAVITILSVFLSMFLWWKRVRSYTGKE